MTTFLKTKIGYLNSSAIVLISRLVVTNTGCYYEIQYNHGPDARSTRATEEAVEEYFEEVHA